MNPYLAFALAAAVTYVLRGSMTIAGDRVARSTRLATVTALVTPAVLASILITGLAGHDGRLSAPPPADLAAVVAAFVVARRTGNFGLALAVGLPVYWLGRLAGLA